MAPAGDMPNPTAMTQSFSLANMVPQNPTQNSGAWSKIEQDTRRYALHAKGNVFVITGPVFGPDSQTISAKRVRVPTHLFKLVYDESTGKTWAHWQPNSEDARPGRPISYDELTQRIGMELLPGHPRGIGAEKMRASMPVKTSTNPENPLRDDCACRKGQASSVVGSIYLFSGIYYPSTVLKTDALAAKQEVHVISLLATQ